MARLHVLALPFLDLDVRLTVWVCVCFAQPVFFPRCFSVVHIAGTNGKGTPSGKGIATEQGPRGVGAQPDRH